MVPEDNFKISSWLIAYKWHRNTHMPVVFDGQSVLKRAKKIRVE